MYINKKDFTHHTINYDGNLKTMAILVNSKIHTLDGK